MECLRPSCVRNNRTHTVLSHIGDERMHVLCNSHEDLYVQWEGERTDNDNMLHEVAFIFSVSFELGNLLQRLEHYRDQFLVSSIHEVSDLIGVGTCQLTFHPTDESLAHKGA